jgi:hypothetical protein
MILNFNLFWYRFARLDLVKVRHRDRMQLTFCSRVRLDTKFWWTSLANIKKMIIGLGVSRMALIPSKLVASDILPNSSNILTSREGMHILLRIHICR